MLRLKQWSWRTWAIAAFLVFVVEEILRSYTVEGTTRLVGYALASLSWLLKRPIGVGGLVLLGWAVLLVTLGWWETRPRPAIEASTDSQPTIDPRGAEELEEIQQLRTFWNLYLQPAVNACDSVLAVVLYELEQRVYWWELAQPKLYRLKRAGQALSEAVDPNSGMRLYEVQKRQDEAWGAYLDALYWCAVIAEKEGIDIAGDPTKYNLSAWRAADAKVREKIRELVQRPAHAELGITPDARPSNAHLRLLYPPENPT